MRRAARLAALALAGVAACHARPPRPVTVEALPPRAYAHYLAGKYALYHDDAAAAVPELEAAAQAAPREAMIVVELARALAKAKRVPEAQRALQTARQTWPRHPHVWLASGEVAEPIDRAEAARAYRRAIELEPTDEHGYLGLARVELADGDVTGAESTLRRLVAKLPESVDGHYRLAQRLAANGKREAATTELRAVLERDPDHLDARVDLSRLLRQLGKLPEAVAQLRSAFDRAGQPMDLAEELYWLLCEADDRQGAIDLLTLLDDDRSDADALATVAAFDRGLGRLAEARAVAEHIRSLDADASTIALAQVDAASGQVQAALDALLAIPASSSRHLQARGVAVVIALQAKRPEVVLAVVEPLRALHPDDLEMRAAAAMAHAIAYDPAKARALAANLPAVARARVLDALGDTAGALAVLEPALPNAPDNVSALNLAGFLLVRRHERLDDAARYLARARDLAPGDPAVLDSWGYLLVQQGKAREAVRILGRAARFSPLEPEIRLHLAAAWAADGAPRHAAGILDRAVAEDPGLCSSYDGDMKRTGVFAMLLVAACSKGPSEGQCKQLLDHLVDLEFKKAGAAASSDQMKAEIAKQKTAVTEAKSKEFLDTCTKKMSKSRVECALKANELDGDSGVAKCDEAK